MQIVSDIKAILGGFRVTLAHMLRKPVTIQYPEEKRVPDGGERCVACYLCSAACPVDCISMQSTERDDGRRYAAWFRINFSRCIFCGLCAEACPTLAIQMTPDFEICKRDIMDLVYEKEDLLIDGCGKDASYNFYRHAGIGVTQPRGAGLEETPPVDVRSLMP